MANLLVTNKEDYKVVTTNCDIDKNSVIHYICCKQSSSPTEHTITLDINYYIIDVLASEINHSFTPNCKVVGDCLISTCKIKKGEEVTRNYYETEEIILKQFVDRESGELINTKNLYLYKNGEEKLDFNEYVDIKIN